jgi:hypothetical protein
MKPGTIRSRVHEPAAKRVPSARQPIFHAIEHAVPEDLPRQKKKRLHLDCPIVDSTGKPFDLTNRELYDLIAFP